MDKKFDIHEWQANQRQKQWLREQEDFTPDLEDDELKRGAIQQMMGKEKGLQKDDYKLVNSISNVADVYSYGEILDALESFYTKNDEQQSAEMARKHAKEFRDFLDTMDKYEKRYGEEDEYDALTPTSDNPDPEGYGTEMDEANTTGTGTSFTAGPSGTGPYASPNVFSKNKNKNKKGPFNTKSGYMGYTEPVKN